jgi:hypothetical protein
MGEEMTQTLYSHINKRKKKTQYSWGKFFPTPFIPNLELGQIGNLSTLTQILYPG